MTLYLKYRPKNLDELDLPEVGESLKKIIASGKIPHAFLFAGPKGTGKTSAARILAKIINCEKPGKNGVPCDKCEQCLSITKGNNLDVIEMDAASHRGIDDVRSLRDAVKLAPAKARKKVYIIDEAHMLTTEACNALLKTLEEPPEHVVFILATTNPEKLIDTIRSRTTLINFRKAAIPEIVKSLKRVVEAEKIKAGDEVLLKIAKVSAGAFRDAIKILEQFSAEGEEYLDRLKSEDVGGFVSTLVKRDEKAALAEIEKNVSKGISMETFLGDLLGMFHKALLSEVGIFEEKIEGLTKNDLITLSELFTEASGKLADSPVEQLPVEIAVVKWCEVGKSAEPQLARTKQNSNPDLIGVGLKAKVSSDAQEERGVSKDKPVLSDSQTIVSGARKHESPIHEEKNGIDVQTVVPEIRSQETYSSGEIGLVNDDIWKNILTAVHPINVSIEGLLRASRPVAYDGSTLTLGVFYKFHKERLEDGKHRKILEEVIAKVLNSPTRVVCTLVDPPVKKIIEEAKSEPVLTEGKDADIIKAAEEIFGN